MSGDVRSQRDARSNTVDARKPREARSSSRPAAKDVEDAGGKRPPRPRRAPEPGMETYRIEVGHRHNVKPGNIVGAIANEAGIESRHIGRIDIEDDHSLVDLPEGMPKQILRKLQKTWVAGQQLKMALAGGAPRAKSHKAKRESDVN
jgi:ATP-dependent RNA helicase DeaD